MARALVVAAAAQLPALAGAVFPAITPNDLCVWSWGPDPLWIHDGNLVFFRVMFEKNRWQPGANLYAAAAFSADRKPSADDNWFFYHDTLNPCSGDDRWKVPNDTWGSYQAPAYPGKMGCGFKTACLTGMYPSITYGSGQNDGAPVLERCRVYRPWVIILCCKKQVSVCQDSWSQDDWNSCNTSITIPRGEYPFPCKCTAPTRPEIWPGYDLSGCTQTGLFPAHECKVKCSPGWEGTASAACETHKAEVTLNGCKPAKCHNGPRARGENVNYSSCTSTYDSSPAWGFKYFSNATCQRSPYYPLDYDYHFRQPAGWYGDVSLQQCAQRCRDYDRDNPRRCSGFSHSGPGGHPEAYYAHGKDVCLLCQGKGGVAGYMATDADPYMDTLFPVVSVPFTNVYSRESWPEPDLGARCRPTCDEGWMNIGELSEVSQVCIDGWFDDTSGIQCVRPPPPPPPGPPPRPPATPPERMTKGEVWGIAGLTLAGILFCLCFIFCPDWKGIYQKVLKFCLPKKHWDRRGQREIIREEGSRRRNRESEIEQARTELIRTFRLYQKYLYDRHQMRERGEHVEPLPGPIGGGSRAPLHLVRNLALVQAVDQPDYVPLRVRPLAHSPTASTTDGGAKRDASGAPSVADTFAAAGVGTAASGAECNEPAGEPLEGWYQVVSPAGATVRAGVELSSALCGEVETYWQVYVVEQQGRRLRVTNACPENAGEHEVQPLEGWVSLCSTDGDPILEALEHDTGGPRVPARWTPPQQQQQQQGGPPPLDLDASRPGGAVSPLLPQRAPPPQAFHPPPSSASPGARSPAPQTPPLGPASAGYAAPPHIASPPLTPAAPPTAAPHQQPALAPYQPLAAAPHQHPAAAHQQRPAAAHQQRPAAAPYQQRQAAPSAAPQAAHYNPAAPYPAPAPGRPPAPAAGGCGMPPKALHPGPGHGPAPPPHTPPLQPYAPPPPAFAAPAAGGAPPVAGSAPPQPLLGRQPLLSQRPPPPPQQQSAQQRAVGGLPADMDPTARRAVASALGSAPPLRPPAARTASGRTTQASAIDL